MNLILKSFTNVIYFLIIFILLSILTILATVYFTIAQTFVLFFEFIMGVINLVFGILEFFIACFAAILSISAQAQDYPTRPVRIITQGAAGSGPDVIARVVFDQLSRQWGQQAVIVNAPVSCTIANP
mgnify:CR=1 FL=1